MAPSTYLALFISLFPFLYASASPSSLCSFKYIYQFGDSLADTGNLIRIPGALSTFHADRLPYGQSFFHRPTGRYSNGRLIIDYTAAALHLPLTPPYLDFNASFTHGANFAVAGATALDQAFFVGKNISIPSFRPPISGQLRWFQSHLNSTCHARSKCVRRRLRDAFFVFGAFGGNDYYNAVFRGKSVEEVRTYVPDIVNAVILGIKRVVGLGAKRVVVPGTYPSGCLPVYLTAFGTSDPKAYDDLGCLKKFNEYSFYYNSHLRKAVPRAQLKWYHAHLNATCHTSSACAGKVRNALFIFGEFGHDDYYNALAQRKSVHDTRAYVPYAVDAVINGVRDIVKSGAKRVIVPGTIPFGCLPVYLTAFRSSDPKAYDDLGCLKTLNDLSSYHNTYLMKALSLLSKELPSDAVVVYGDYYGAFRSVLRQASSLGFDSGSLLKACCGAGGVYNFDAKKMCGSGNVPVCSNPARSINWDGFHPTDETNHRMSEILIDQVLRKITCG